MNLRLPLPTTLNSLLSKLKFSLYSNELMLSEATTRKRPKQNDLKQEVKLDETKGSSK